jgi:hypothetical protein
MIASRLSPSASCDTLRLAGSSADSATVKWLRRATKFVVLMMRRCSSRLGACRSRFDADASSAASPMMVVALKPAASKEDRPHSSMPSSV